MMEKKIDITSTAIEKGIDLIKDFLDKLISPAIEETGLLIKDKAASWRFNNQLKALGKAKEKCEQYNISTKVISFKLLFPLLEYAGLEDDEVMQDKWANLLTNMVDSEQNINNHVFPYILSQISRNEFELLEMVYRSKIERKEKFTKELSEFMLTKDSDIQHLELRLEEIKNTVASQQPNSTNRWSYHTDSMNLREGIRKINKREKEIKDSINRAEIIPYSLEEYEFANLIRLGLVKVVPKPYAYMTSHRIQNDPQSEYLEIMDMPIEISIEDEDLIMTELGELFIIACNDKIVKNNKPA